MHAAISMSAVKSPHSQTYEYAVVVRHARADIQAFCTYGYDTKKLLICNVRVYEWNNK